MVASERVFGKRHPQPKVIKSFGTAVAPQDIQKLQQAAQAYLHNLFTGQTLRLLINSEQDIASCHCEVSGFKDIYGKLFDHVFNDLSLSQATLRMLSDLVIMRIVEPVSKRRTSHICLDYGIHLGVDTIYKLMDKLNSEQIKKLVFNHTQQLLRNDHQKLDVLFYDLTTIAFETNSQDNYREFGFSKDGKHQHVQMTLAIIATQEGLPISYELFKGNTYEGHTLIPTLHKLRTVYDIARVVVVADSGLMSRDNIAAIKAAGLEYVMGARVKNLTQPMLRQVFEAKDYQPLNEDIKAKFIAMPGNDNLLVCHSVKRAKKEAYDRKEAIEKIQKHLGSSPKGKLTGVLRKSYVKLSRNSVIEIDADKIADCAKFDGYFALQTNIAHQDKQAILQQYKSLWQIEQTFRIAKHNLRIRPVFHYTPKRIQAHFTICYMALALVRFVEHIMHRSNCYIPLEQLHILLRQVKTVFLTCKSETFCLTTNWPRELIPLYHSLDLPPPQRFFRKM